MTLSEERLTLRNEAVFKYNALLFPKKVNAITRFLVLNGFNYNESMDYFFANSENWELDLSISISLHKKYLVLTNDKKSDPCLKIYYGEHSEQELIEIIYSFCIKIIEETPF